MLSLKSKEVVKFLCTVCWPRWKGLHSVQFVRMLTFGSWGALGIRSLALGVLWEPGALQVLKKLE